MQSLLRADILKAKEVYMIHDSSVAARPVEFGIA